MKTLYKSLLSIVLILSMCIGSVGAANLTTKDLSEMDFESSTDLYEGVSMLMGLGILKDTDTFPANLGEGISRAHFLEFVMRFALDGVYNTSGVTLPFTDVSSSASYYGALAAAVAQGIIMEDTNFRPDDYITYEEALTVMFRVYELDAILDPSLPWPQNYVNLATKLKLYKGDMLLDHDGYLTYEGFFKLMKDVLEANVVEANYTTGGIEYTISDDKYHEVWYDVYEFEGTVEANGITNIDSDGTYKEDYLIIDGKNYFAGDNYQSFLGYDVEGFYKEDDFNTIISISKKYCKELVINAEDIEGVTLSGSTVNIKYDDNGSMKDARISTSANVIYNGKSFANDRFYIEWYDISRGSITLVTKNSSTYDIAFIDEYESYIVTGVDTQEEGIIYLKDSEPVILEDTTSYSITDADGKSITLADIAIDNVVSLKKAYDDTRLEIIVSTEKFSSPLTSVAAADKLLYFGAREYEVESSAFIETLSLGTSYDVYVDAFGYIVDCVDAAQDDVSVGYIIAAHYDSWKKTASVLMLKEGDEEPFEYQLADKVKIDGKNYKIKDIINTANNDPSSSPLFAGNTVPKEFVIYKFDTSGKISYIDTPTLGENEDKKTTLYKKIDTDNYVNPLYTTEQINKIRNKGLYLKNNKFGYYYDSAFQVAGIPKSLIALNKNTMCVNIPTTKDENDQVIETPFEDYETVSYSAVPDEDWHKSLVLYTLGTEGLVAIGGCFKGLGGGGSIADKDVLYVVARIAFAQKDDEWMRRITVVRNGVETNIYVNPEDETKGKITIPADLSVGDSISYKTDTAGYVTAFKKYFDYKTQTILNNNSFAGQVRIGGGYIYDWEGGYYSIVTDPNNFNAEYPEVLVKPSGGYIYEVSGKELIYEPMTESKIVKFSSAGTGATIYISKLGYGVNRAFHYYRGQASDEDTYGDLRASFYEKQGAASYSTILADTSGNITIPENTFENAGNEFMGWSDGRNVFAPGDTYRLTNYNVSFYPVWETSYKHSFVSDAADATGEAPLDIWSIAGEEITLPKNTFARIGWKFMGWTDGTNTYPEDAKYLVQSKNVEFKATWKEARNATFAAPSADYTGTAPTTIGALAGEKFNLPENTFTRDVSVGTYEFKGWKLGETTYQAGDEFTMPDNNVEFTAVFEYKGGTATIAPAASVRVLKQANASGGFDYTSPSSGHLWARIDLGGDGTYTDAVYRAIKLDLTGLKAIDLNNITSIVLNTTASKVDNSQCKVYAYRCDGVWEGTDFATEAIPAIGSVITDCGLNNQTLNRTLDLTAYIKEKLQSGADYAIVFITANNSSSKRINTSGGYRYSSASFTVTTTN